MLFPVGKVKLTKRILEHSNIGVPDLVDAFERYIQGDWGELNGPDSLANDIALTSGDQISALYRLFDGTAFVMTTAEGITTVQLPEEWHAGPTPRQTCGTDQQQ